MAPETRKREVSTIVQRLLSVTKNTRVQRPAQVPAQVQVQVPVPVQVQTRPNVGNDLNNAVSMFNAIKILNCGRIVGSYGNIDSIDSSKITDILENESYILHNSDSEYIRMIGQYNDQSSLYLYKGEYYIIIVRQYDNEKGEYATINLNNLF